MHRQRGVGIIAVIGIVLIVAGVSAYVTLRVGPPKEIRFQTPYQAVLLMGGQAYFGKLEGYGTQNPVLSDVFYVQTNTNPETKQVSSVLVKRGREWHGPDRMYLNPSHIILVEPVSPNSKVAQLISETKSR